MQRVIFSLVLIVLFFLIPWYLVALFTLVGLFLFDDYYEFFLISILIYSVYTPMYYFITPFIFAISILIIFFGLNYLKKYIILYQK